MEALINLMVMVVTLAAVAFAGLCDFLRGSNRWIYQSALTKVLWTLLYGVCLAILAGVDGWMILASAGLWWVGSKGGWGYPIGHAMTGVRPEKWDIADGHVGSPETWQELFNIEDDPWLSLVIRGLMWGMPQMFIAYWSPEVLFLTGAMLIAFPLSVLIATVLLPEEIQKNPRRMMERQFWCAAGMELYRGWLCALLVMLLAWLT